MEMINGIKKRAKIREDKVVELNIDDFENLINALRMCRENESKLKEVVAFLNRQIQQYNKKFTK
jgi:hypothetical protein